MPGFTKLFASITDSTIWREPDRTRLVWVTMLAMADAKGYVAASVPGLADRARVPLADCLTALQAFREPDEWSRTQDYEGRRIIDTDGGWQLLNHAKYRAVQDAETRREASRLGMQSLRAERKLEAVSKVNDVSSGDGSFTQAEAEAEANTSNLSVALARQAEQLPDCPHLEILLLWAETLPAMPRHLPSQWKGARADHLRARWKETASSEKWATKTDGLVYLRRLFDHIGESRFLTGRSRASKAESRPFLVELEWLVRPANWAKVLEGKYHGETA